MMLPIDGPIFDFVKQDMFARFLDSDMAENRFSKNFFGYVSAKPFFECDLMSGTAAGRFHMTAA